MLSQQLGHLDWQNNEKCFLRSSESKKGHGYNHLEERLDS
jgi:hypothetical protein